jgi:hypothetical protein
VRGSVRGSSPTLEPEAQSHWAESNRGQAHITSGTCVSQFTIHSRVLTTFLKNPCLEYRQCSPGQTSPGHRLGKGGDGPRPSHGILLGTKNFPITNDNNKSLYRRRQLRGRHLVISLDLCGVALSRESRTGSATTSCKLGFVIHKSVTAVAYDPHLPSPERVVMNKVILSPAKVINVSTILHNFGSF